MTIHPSLQLTLFPKGNERLLEFSKSETAEAAADHRHTWVFCRAAGGKFLSDDLTAQTKGQILGGSPSASWATPRTRWDCISLLCLPQHGGEEGGSRAAPGDRGKAEGHKGTDTEDCSYPHGGAVSCSCHVTQILAGKQTHQ